MNEDKSAAIGEEACVSCGQQAIHRFDCKFRPFRQNVLPRDCVKEDAAQNSSGVAAEPGKTEQGLAPILERIKQIIREETPIIEEHTSPFEATKLLRRKIIWRIEDEQHTWNAGTLDAQSVEQLAREAAEKIDGLINSALETRGQFGKQVTVGTIAKLITDTFAAAPSQQTGEAAIDALNRLAQTNSTFESGEIWIQLEQAIEAVRALTTTPRDEQDQG